MDSAAARLPPSIDPSSDNSGSDSSLLSPFTSTLLILLFDDSMMVYRCWSVAISTIVVLLLVSLLSTTSCLSFKSLSYYGRRLASLRGGEQSNRNASAAASSFSTVSSSAAAAAASTTTSWWEDLAPPFMFSDDSLEDSLEDDDYTDNDCDSPNVVTHFCFLVHGHRGYSRDLNYVRARMRKVAAAETKKQRLRRRKRRRPSDSDDASSSDHDNNPTETETEDEEPELIHQLVVHATVCNERKTDDGVEAGGTRLVEEMLQVIRETMQKKKPTGGSSPSVIQDVTISMVGNSLGGIYSRYAIAKLAERCQSDKPEQHKVEQHANNHNNHEQEDHVVIVLDGLYRLHWNVFCTTATPHLGIAGHTFLPLPRRAELGVAHAMGETGRDLFRCNALLHTMATSAHYLTPLGAFCKRIAYANAYGTDFPVPVHTAAFLSESSNYPHHFMEETTTTTTLSNSGTGSENDDKDPAADALVENEVPTSTKYVAATLHTPVRQASNPVAQDQDNAIGKDEDPDDDLLLMSSSLDALGWKKVLLDVRKEIPKISIPRSLLLRKGSSKSNMNSDPEDDDDAANNNTSNNNSNKLTLDLLKQRGIVRSQDVAAAVSAPPLLLDDTFYWPVGHNMIVAFSRSRWSTYMNKAGRPVVDGLCQSMVQDIFTWKRPTTTSSSTSLTSSSSSSCNNNTTP